MTITSDTAYGLCWGFLGRFVRVVGAAFLAGGAPGAVSAVTVPVETFA